MHLFYVDESGVPNSWNDQDNFVLGAVAVHEGQVRRLSQALDEVQKRFFPTIQVPLEFHASVIRNGRGRFRRMEPNQRDDIMSATYDVIAKAGFPNLVAFVTAIHVTAVTNPTQALRDCLEDICERFNMFLVRQFKAGYPDKGILIMDRSGREERVRNFVADFEQHGTRRGHLGNIVDVPYFADSRHTRMLQLADFVAFAGGRYFNHGDDTYLLKILDRIDKRPRKRGHKHDGLKHIVGSGFDCSCLALH